jgi:hypothetical protein
MVTLDGYCLIIKFRIIIRQLDFSTNYYHLHNIFKFCFTDFMNCTSWIISILCSQRFEGNGNTYSAELRQVSPPIIGKRIRFIPYCRNPRTVCLRVELYGCTWEGTCHSFSYQGYNYQPAFRWSLVKNY